MAFATQLLFGLVESEVLSWREREGTTNFHTMEPVLLENMLFYFPKMRDFFFNPVLSD